MKLYYFNDTDDSQAIFIRDLHDDPSCLYPATGDYFEIELKENQIPFIKVWGGTVLISFMDLPKS